MLDQAAVFFRLFLLSSFSSFFLPFFFLLFLWIDHLPLIGLKGFKILNLNLKAFFYSFLPGQSEALKPKGG
jgi:hypothetical protein